MGVKKEVISVNICTVLYQYHLKSAPCLQKVYPGHRQHRLDPQTDEIVLAVAKPHVLHSVSSHAHEPMRLSFMNSLSRKRLKCRGSYPLRPRWANHGPSCRS